MTFTATHPTFFRQNNRNRLSRHQLVFRQGLGFCARDDWRTTVIAVGFGVFQQFSAHQLFQLGFAAQQGLQLGLFFTQRILLVAQLHLFQTGQLAQARIKDVVGLGFTQGKTRNQLGLGVFLGADDVDHFIEVQVSGEQTVQQVQAALDFIEAELQAAAHGVDAELQPFHQQCTQVFQLRLAVQADDIDVDPKRGFQLGNGEQVLHQFAEVDLVVARNDDDTARVFVVRFVAQVGDHRQFGRLGLHQRGNLLQHLGTGHLMRQRGNHDVTVFDVVHGAHAHRTTAGLVDLQQVGARGDDLGFGRIVRALNMLTQLLNRGLGLVEQTHAGRRHFTQVVRWHVGGHAHGDTGGAIEQDIG